MEPRFDYGGTFVPEEIARERFDRMNAERIYFERVRPRLIESLRKRGNRTCQDKYNHLKNDALERGINVDNIFADTNAKKRALVDIMNWKGLRIGSGKRNFVSIDGAKPERVGEAYRRCVYRAD